jgi:hypothetical protein
MVDLSDCQIWNHFFKSRIKIIKSDRGMQDISDKVAKFLATDIQDKYTKIHI